MSESSNVSYISQEEINQIKRIDVSNDLIKMGINIVVPGKTQNASLKSLSEANFKNDTTDNNNKTDKKSKKSPKTNQITERKDSSNMDLNKNKMNRAATVHNICQNNNYGASSKLDSKNEYQSNKKKGLVQKANTTTKIKESSSCNSISSQQILYNKYLTNDEIQKGIENKILIQGKLRINQRSYENAYIADPNGGGDIYICGVKDRNRALNNDVVAIKLKEKYNWKILDNFKNQVIESIDLFEKQHSNDLVNLEKLNISKGEMTKVSKNKNQNNNDKLSELIELAPLSYSKPDLLKTLDDDWFQKTGFVVGILEKKNNRLAAGHLKLFPDRNKEYALFSPNDSRLPRIKIKLIDCPPDFYNNHERYSNTIFIAYINDIPSNSKYANGNLIKSIGQEGNIEVETEAILIENGIDYSEFVEQVNEYLPQLPWSIPKEEFSYRRDLRDYLIFTIDPETARDLDDALHIIKLDDEHFEIGVHIADVSYFVNEDSIIDKYAKERTTSVYLVQKVIPMLPRILCEHVCSLNPDTDRLSFSVIWKIKSNGDVVSEWFGRTVINSAVKLSYEHAQRFIENPDDEFDPKSFPSIRKKFNINDIKTSVLNLHTVAKQLRNKRFENGCLTLNQAKLNFIINKDSGMPYAYNVYQQKDSNRLVEEFMLLANIAVAHKIYDFYPKKAILRRHPRPNAKQIEQLGESIKLHGFDCDVNSSGSIQSFMQSIQKENSTASLTLTCLLTKTMQLAQYFCSGANLPKEHFFHYGLCLPLYTHFTSPIRRYPDLLVHRLLASSLGYQEETKRNAEYLQMIAENCNDKKYNARVCSEKSTEMFFSIFVNECGPLEEPGCVIAIRDHSFDVLLFNLGISKRVYCDKLDIEQDSIIFEKSELKPRLSWYWKITEKHNERVQQTLELFSTVNILISKQDNDPTKFNVILLHPNEKLKLNNRFSVKKDENQVLDEHFFEQIIDIDPYICD